MAAMMLCGRATPNVRCLNAGLYDVLTRVDNYTRRVSGTSLSVSTVALIVVAWQDSYPKEVPYSGG